ncbi:MAG: hypothetical protein ACOZIN_14635 [Myxococcota bacterium]
MVNVLDLFIGLVGLALAGFVLQKNLWRALLCVAPHSMRIEPDAPADAMRVPGELSRLEADVKALGFVPIGSRLERPRLTKELVSYDFAHVEDKVFVTLYLGRDRRPRLYFLSHTDRDAFVITANYRRPAREVPGRYFCGALEDASTERVFKAHQRRVASFGSPVGRFDQEGRLAAARAWFGGPGKVEVRLQNLHGLLWSVGTLGMVAAALFGKR